jgi:hypothetical protein
LGSGVFNRAGQGTWSYSVTPLPHSSTSGTMRWMDGSILAGEFKNGKVDGFGKLLNAFPNRVNIWPRVTDPPSILAGRWSGPNGNVTFAGTFVDDFPAEGIWTDRSGASFDVILREKTVLSNYFSEGDSIFTSKKKKGAKDEPVLRPQSPSPYRNSTVAALCNVSLIFV